MLAEHILSLLGETFPDDIITEIIGEVPDPDEEKVGIIVNVPEGVDPEYHYIGDPVELEVDISIIVNGRKFSTTEYSVRKKTREIINLLDVTNLTDEQRLFTDGDDTYNIKYMQATTQSYGITEEDHYASAITFNTLYQIY